MTTTIRTPAVATTVLAIALLVFSACAGMTRTERGAAIGAAGGAAVGAAIDSNTARGAIIGAAIGGTAGAIIGRRMDQQAEELDRSIEGAEVERVGEGILVTFDSGILFDFDSAALRSASRQNLQNLARSLQRYPESEVLIVGHTDSTGSAEYNMGLSQRRADSAAQYLISQGVERTRVRVEGRGEHEPIASNATAEGRQQNRRVEVAIFASEEYRERILRETR